ncbi:ATP-binding protein [Larsenimonas suaedae]|uniref:histidine kinase n=1 Tax=Larsenimonas suaedae TaxID=1851019 RepID=A0ABU1GU55_9GAMM|nr:ATP-binding protein [Larsenimonas suaedae]MCM2972008.1 ATP-binding protein [Larsenimonas suaedae]MDR5895560.1 ATP-binding protein [Larsenimonas suaedae]
MFKHFGVKLFASILLVNILISGTIYWTMARSIDSGFIDYIRISQTKRVDNLTQVLVQSFREHGNSWQFLNEQPGTWDHLLRFGFGASMAPARYDVANDNAPPNASDDDSVDEDAPPRLPPKLGDPAFYALLDHNRRPVVLAPHIRLDRLNQRRLMLDGNVIGYLRYPRVQAILSSIDRIFVSRQLRNLGITMSGTLLASLVLSAGLGWWLSRRTKRMAAFTQDLTRGEFSKRLSSSGRDELSRLSQDLNTLAVTLDHNRKARQSWVADIAHELRTPLAVLKGELEAIADGIRPANGTTIASLTQEVDQLNRLVEDLRILAQSDANALSAPLAPLNLSAQLQTRLEESRYRLEAQRIELTYHLASEIYIDGAEHRLRQLWNNLLENTLFYTDAPGRLEVTLTQRGPCALVTWEDSAPGVPTEAHERLTERLYRVETSRSRRLGGSGLGLSIAAALIDLHHGRMWAEHSPLGGLRWRLEFPLTDSDRNDA